MEKFMRIIRDEKGQGMLEYVVAVGGIILVAGLVITALKTGLVGDGNGGATKAVTDKIDSTVTNSIAP